MPKKPLTPLRAALWVLFLAVVAGGVILALTLPERPGESPFENGQRVGNLVAAPALMLAVLTYLAVYFKQKRSR
jgi:hypothetical protein